MNTLSLEGWCKPAGNARSQPIGLIHFRVPETTHRQLEKAEEALSNGSESEKLLDADIADMEIETSAECGPLADCQLRVYIHKDDQRGHFHLIGHRATDGSLIYTNAVMVDQLG